MVTTTTGPATRLLRKLGRATQGWNVIGLTGDGGSCAGYDVRRNAMLFLLQSTKHNTQFNDRTLLPDH
jgi:hypothetical protein